MGLAEGCRLLRDLPKDAVLTCHDVVLPAGRLVDRLRAEQDAAFPAPVTDHAPGQLAAAQ